MAESYFSYPSNVIKNITLPNGAEYALKDDTLRAYLQTNDIKSKLAQITTNATAIAALQAGGLTYKIVDSLPTAAEQTLGSIYMVPKTTGQDKHVYIEYLTVKVGTAYKWQEIGDTQIDLSNYAQKGAGVTVSSGTAANSKTGISLSGHSVTQGDVSVNGKFTPSGSIAVGTGTANYTPGGSLTGGAITVTPSTTTKYVASSASGGGSVTNGQAASCTLPNLTTTVTNEVLSIGWSAGSFTANTPTAVTLPSFSSQTIATGITSASITTQPTFTGTGVELTFSGTEGNVSASGKTTGVAVSAHTITDNGHTHTVTGSGTINS